MDSLDSWLDKLETEHKNNGRVNNITTLECRLKALFNNVLDHPTMNKVVCVTSGGTIAPLEENMVRFIDNFRCRGALSAEQFLRSNYAVVYFHRRGSLLPYVHRVNQKLQQQQQPQLQHELNNQKDFTIFNWFTINSQNNKLQVTESASQHLIPIINEFNMYSQYLLTTEFETVEEYLIGLRWIARQLATFTKNSITQKRVYLCFYLSAAVSDYYLPNEDRPEHKIQTQSALNTTANDEDNQDKSMTVAENLKLTLQPVPKVMKLINTIWAPESYVISFKLETDHQKLLSKAKQSLRINQSNVIVANLLHTRSKEVWLVFKQNGGQDTTFEHINMGSIGDKQENWTTTRGIESVLVPRLINLHEQTVLQL
ncbi:unnamed protein product [Heterobilharzia americana]|nr:unnamed protein product [Heterobilharzia americana]